jgi:hypothetical protein
MPEIELRKAERRCLRCGRIVALPESFDIGRDLEGGKGGLHFLPIESHDILCPSVGQHLLEIPPALERIAQVDLCGGPDDMTFGFHVEI